MEISVLLAERHNDAITAISAREGIERARDAALSRCDA